MKQSPHPEAYSRTYLGITSTTVIFQTSLCLAELNTVDILRLLLIRTKKGHARITR